MGEGDTSDARDTRDWKRRVGWWGPLASLTVAGAGRGRDLRFEREKPGAGDRFSLTGRGGGCAEK